MVNSIWGLSCLKNLFHDRFAALLSSTGAYNCVKCSEGMKCPALSSLVACLQTPTGGVDLLCWQSPQLVFDLLGVFQPNISKTVRRVVGTLPWFLNSLACLLFLATVHHQLESGKQPQVVEEHHRCVGSLRVPGKPPFSNPHWGRFEARWKWCWCRFYSKDLGRLLYPWRFTDRGWGRKNVQFSGWMDGWMDGN